MKSNQLVNQVVVGSHQTMGIYKLTKDQMKKFSGGKPYFLSSGVFSDFAFTHMSDAELIGNIEPHYYEGFFETEREAYLQAKLIRAEAIIQMTKNAINGITIPEFSWNAETMKEDE